jgi:SAM-dependent methyltransferase
MGVRVPGSYDEVRYPSFPRNQSHPAFISALSAIAGFSLPPVEGWRVLEIGCGDGSNILPLALDYPEGMYVGVDRAQIAIEVGRELASRLHLTNIELHPADLLQWAPEGEFDYIIAHGVFSWVPKEIREKILQICSAALKPRGVAYISYNALPGCYFRRFVGDFLQFHVRHLTDPAVRIRKARELAQFIADRPGGDEPQPLAIRDEMQTVLEKDETVLYHDDLAEVNEPFYLLDFVAQAERHGLQYLGDADPLRDDVRDLPLQSEDWIESRQYCDFLTGRRFRETLLCRCDIPLERMLLLNRFRDLFAASRVKPAEPDKDGQQQFDLPKAGNLKTNHPFVKHTLCRLASLWPESIRICELPIDEYPPEEIAGILQQLLEMKALELRTHPPKIASSISDRPVASALARTQIAGGYRRITNQRHMSVELGDETSRMVLSLLDGSRDRGELIRDLLASGTDPDMIHGTLESGLAELHRLCLLIG